MTWNEMRKLAIKQGFMLARHGGSHDVYEHATTKKRIFRHWSQEIRKGLKNRLLKEIGL